MALISKAGFPALLGTRGFYWLFIKNIPIVKVFAPNSIQEKKRPINEYTCFKGACQGKFVLFVYGLVILSGEV